MPQLVKDAESDLYSDTPDTAAATPEAEVETGESENADEGDDYGKTTALLPLKFLGEDVSPGDTMTVKVVRVHDNQVEVSCQKSKDATETEEVEEAPATTPEGGMSSMME